MLDPNIDIVFGDEKSTDFKRLSETFPEEVQFFSRKYIWSSNKGGFYSREKYFGTQHRTPWRPFKRGDGRWQHFYANLVSELAEKHLDFERFCRCHPPKSQVRPKDNETAFWLGTMAGDRTWNDCLDVDSHDVIGYYAVHSRWHPSRRPASPLAALAHYDDCQWRLLPVVTMPLSHFRLLKKLHSVFINRIWAFSSGNLGFGLWRVYPRAKKTSDRHDVLRRQLAGVELDHIEAYPRPPRSQNSLGKCHRRPCGMDSGIITERGLVTDPIAQVRCYMSPPPTPSFETICAVLFHKLEEMYSKWIAWDGSEPLTVISKDKSIEKAQRPETGAALKTDLKIVKDWLASGCPKEKTVVAMPHCPVEENDVVDDDAPTVNNNPPAADNHAPTVNNHALLPCGEQGMASIEEILAPQDQRPYPDYFYKVDLQTINKNERWVQFCLFLAHHGFPCHDRFLEVVSTLAKWFAFYELHHLLPDRTHIKEVLASFCVSRNNGYITRLEEGRVAEVIASIDRVVDDVIDGEDDAGNEVFAEMRMKRDTGQYPVVYQLEPLMASGEASSSYIVSFSGPIICGSLGSLSNEEAKEETEEDWVYAPDGTPLPEILCDIIMKAFDKGNSPLRSAMAQDWRTSGEDGIMSLEGVSYEQS